VWKITLLIICKYLHIVTLIVVISPNINHSVFTNEQYKALTAVSASHTQTHDSRTTSMVSSHSCLEHWYLVLSRWDMPQWTCDQTVPLSVYPYNLQKHKAHDPVVQISVTIIVLNNIGWHDRSWTISISNLSLLLTVTSNNFISPYRYIQWNCSYKIS